MICVTSVWNGQESFKVIPLVENCPYVEMIYDPEASMLVIISKIIKDAYHMIPKMDDKGDIVPAKNRKSPDKREKVGAVISRILPLQKGGG